MRPTDAFVTDPAIGAPRSAPAARRASVSRARNPWSWCAVGLALIVLAACGGGAPDGSAGGDTEPTEKAVVVAYPVDIEGVNELTTQSTAVNNALFYHALFLPLLEELADYQEGPPTLAPRLAERYEFSDDQKQLTFYLRDDVEWSDGVPVTAEDVRFTWQAHTSPDVAWSFAEVKAHITDVEVVDPHTVRFHFDRVYGAQVLDANLGVVLPKHAWSQLPFAEWPGNGQWFLDNLVVNGPFALDSWEPQQRFVLVRNPKYFEPELPKLDRVVFEIVRDPSAQVAMLRSGAAHLVEFVPPAQARELEAADDTYLDTYIPRFFYYLMWNVRHPALADATTRRALTHGIDRTAIIESLFYGYATPAHSPFASDVWAHNDTIEPWPYDPSRARELLAEAGWQDSDGDGVVERNGEPLRFQLMTNSENDLRRDIVVMIQDQLKRIGVDVETRIMEFNAMFGPLQQGEFDGVVLAMAMDTSLNTDYFFHTRGIDEGYNWGGFSNRELDDVIDAIESAPSPAEAKPLFDRLQEILHEEQPMVFLYEGLRLCGARNELQDIQPNAINSFANIRHWRLVEGD